MPALSLHSPLGPLTLREENGSLVAVDWRWDPDSRETGLLALAREQLAAYFDGVCKAFSLPLTPAGTAFQHRVWAALCGIPYGEVRSYGALARELNSAPRAVGAACARNPLPIFIPCHRVVAADGALTGYSGGDGLASKSLLLDIERNGPRLL